MRQNLHSPLPKKTKKRNTSNTAGLLYDFKKFLLYENSRKTSSSKDIFYEVARGIRLFKIRKKKKLILRCWKKETLSRRILFSKKEIKRKYRLQI